MSSSWNLSQEQKDKAIGYWKNLNDTRANVKYWMKSNAQSNDFKYKFFNLYEDNLDRKRDKVKVSYRDNILMVPRKGLGFYTSFNKLEHLLTSMKTSPNKFFRQRRNNSRWKLDCCRLKIDRLIDENSNNGIFFTEEEKKKVQEAIDILREVKEDWNKNTLEFEKEVDIKL